MAMTVPARTDTAGSIRRLAAGPRAPGWGDVRRDVVTEVPASTAAVTELRAAVTELRAAVAQGRAPDTAELAVCRAAAAVELHAAVLRELGAQVGCADFGEAVVEAEIRRAVDDLREALIAAGPCPHRRLRVLS